MAKPIHLLVLLMSAGTTISAQTGQPADTIWKSKHYSGLIGIISAGIQFSPPPGSIAISMPYSLTDASGTTINSVFRSPPKKVYHVVRPELLAFEYEYGRKKYYSSVRVAQSMEGGSLAGFRVGLGAGLNWYVQDRHAAAQHRDGAGTLIQTGVNLVFNEDVVNRNAVLGGIDDVGDTVRILGVTAGPTFTIPGTKNTNAGTVASNHVDICYMQNEVAIMPMVSITRHFLSARKIPIRVDIGYSIPVRDHGYVNIAQDDGNAPGKGHLEPTGGPVTLGNPAVSVTYNGAPVKRAPYWEKGMYVSVSLWTVGTGKKGRRKR